LALDKV